MSENSSSSKSVQQETQYAIWQRAFRARNRAAGLRVMSAWVPVGMDARLRRAMKSIIYQCQQNACFLWAVERITDLIGDGRACTVWRDDDGWHVRDAGPGAGRN